MADTEDEVMCPGQRVGTTDEFVPGRGTYCRGSKIFASLVGRRTVQSPSAAQLKPTVEIVRAGDEQLAIPEVGSLVTVRVTSVNPRFAKVNILCVGATPLKDDFRGMIRVQDVRATEKDKVEIYKSFRPGDVVLARVISLGDARSYILSTAENILGVVYATSTTGAPLVPISWCEMQCERTGAREFRKVANLHHYTGAGAAEDADAAAASTAAAATPTAMAS